MLKKTARVAFAKILLAIKSKKNGMFCRIIKIKPRIDLNFYKVPQFKPQGNMRAVINAIFPVST